MQRVLITGGMGQVGSYVAERLCNRCEVVVLDNFSSNCLERLPDEIEVVNGDIRDFKTLMKIVKKIDIIIHCAAQISVTRSLQEPEYDLYVNAGGTLNLLIAAENSSISRFIYLSSAAVFGVPEYLPVDEKHPQNPISPYGVSKLAGEKYCMVYSYVHNLPVVCIRPFNIYSPRQSADNPYSGVICKFIDRVKNSEPPVIEGDGTQTRDFISVHDVVDFILLAMKKKQSIGEIYNLGTGKPTSIKVLSQGIIELTGLDMKPIYAKPRIGDIKHSYADISKIKELGFKPKVDLRKGLKEFLRD